MFHNVNGRAKQTARKSTGGSVGTYSMAGQRREDNDEDLEDQDEDELDQEADDDSMASENDRLQSLRQKLDLTRDELDAELKKRADRDKELVASVEKQVEDLRSEIDSILKCRADTDGQIRLESAIASASGTIVQAIQEHGEGVASAINDGIVNEIKEQGAEFLELMRS